MEANTSLDLGTSLTLDHALLESSAKSDTADRQIVRRWATSREKGGVEQTVTGPCPRCPITESDHPPSQLMLT